MTVGEISDVLRLNAERNQFEANAKTDMLKALIESEKRFAAFNAYWSGAYSRSDTKIPRNLLNAFPEIFGRTHGGGIKAENWQEAERALVQIAANFNRNKGGGKNGNGNR